MSIIPTGDAAGALASFDVIAGPQAGETVPIRQPVVSIGKGSQNDLVLTDDSVSTSHARLEYRDGGWRLTDLGSTNGTYVDDTRLASNVPTPLRYDGAVRFGFVRLQFRQLDAADPEAARAAYAAPEPQVTIRERHAGARFPVWLLLLLVLLVLILGAIVFGWMWTDPAPVPPQPISPAAPAALLTPTEAVAAR